MMVQHIKCNGTEKKLLDCIVTFIDYDKEGGNCFLHNLFSLRCVDG